MKIIQPTKVPIHHRVVEFRRRSHFARHTDAVGTRCSGKRRENGTARASVWGVPTARTGVGKCSTGQSFAANDRVRMSETGAHAIGEGTKLDGTSLAIANGAVRLFIAFSTTRPSSLPKLFDPWRVDSSTLVNSSARHAPLPTEQES